MCSTHRPHVAVKEPIRAALRKEKSLLGLRHEKGSSVSKRRPIYIIMGGKRNDLCRTGQHFSVWKAIRFKCVCNIGLSKRCWELISFALLPSIPGALLASCRHWPALEIFTQDRNYDCMGQRWLSPRYRSSTHSVVTGCRPRASHVLLASEPASHCTTLWRLLKLLRWPQHPFARYQ